MNVCPAAAAPTPVLGVKVTVTTARRALALTTAFGDAPHPGATLQSVTRTVRLYPAYPVMALLFSSEKVVQLVPMAHGETLQVVDVGAALLDDVPASLNATEMAKRQFREIARVAGLVFPGLPRSGKTARQLQASSSLFFDVFRRYDPQNLLLSQAHREVLERQLESSRLGRTLERLSHAEIVITQPKRVTPLAFALLVDRTRERVSSESVADRIRRMQVALEKAADKPVVNVRGTR